MKRNEADPLNWLGDTPMLDLQGDRLRLRVQTVTQLCRTDADKLKAIGHYVAAIPFDVPALGTMQRTRTTLAHHRKAVGWYSKAALFQAMARVAGFPARVRMIRVGPDMYRGLSDDRGVFPLPVVEVWTQHRWVVTDSYVYDPLYLAAAREALQRRGWRSGYGIHLDGQPHWDGQHDALVMIVPERPAGATRPAQFLGVYEDPGDFARQVRKASLLRWLLMLARNRIMSIRISARVRQLRRGLPD